VKHEFTNWRDEQRAWRETCALFDQSHHMTDLYIEGVDALKLISDLGVNTFKNFKVNQAKQFVACTPDGYVIGDAILFYLAENSFVLVGRPPAANWMEYHAGKGGYKVKVTRDVRSAEGEGKRLAYRFQVQGPKALAVMEKVLGKTPPDIRFFNMSDITIAGCTVGALRHGMVGQPGWELYGPWADRDAVRRHPERVEELPDRLGRGHGRARWVMAPEVHIELAVRESGRHLIRPPQGQGGLAHARGAVDQLGGNHFRPHGDALARGQVEQQTLSRKQDHWFCSSFLTSCTKSVASSKRRYTLAKRT
jgi:hypothetical protein